MKSSYDPRELDQRNLLVGADWAVAHNDTGTLIYITQLLAERIEGVLGSELAQLAQQLRDGGTSANRTWPLLRAKVIDELDAAGGSG